MSAAEQIAMQTLVWLQEQTEQPSLEEVMEHINWCLEGISRDALKCLADHLKSRKHRFRFETGNATADGILISSFFSGS
jgi:hypothetical protein